MKKICLNWTISLLSGIFVLFLLSVFGFICKLPINCFYLPIAICISIGLIIYFTLKDFDKNQIKLILSQLIILLDFILICGGLCYFIPDISYDGTTYHQATIILLKWGLNPIYDNIQNFITSQKYVFTSSIPYVEGFLKFFEIIGANIYTCFDKIELTKITNYTFMIIAWCYTFYTLKNFNLNNITSIIFSSIFVYNPICVCQMLSNYVDAIFYYTFLILLFAFINYTKGFDTKKSLYLIFVSSVIFANIKLTGLFTLFIMFFVFCIIYRSKTLLKVFSIAIIFILLSGINPYFTNINQGRNAFYPIIQNSLINANKDFMITSYPQGFENMNRFEKFFFSTFAVSKNLSPLIQSDDVPRLKIPFTISGDDIFIFEDMRLGGFGYFFSGILLFSLILGAFLRFNNNEDKKTFWTIMSILLISIFGNHEAWWARFIPQFWTLPIFITLFFTLNKNRTQRQRFFVFSLISYCFINSLIINIQYFSFVLNSAITSRESIKKVPKTLYISENYPKLVHKFETSPVKLAEYGIEVIYTKENP